MTIEFVLGIQIIADIVLCLAIIFLIRMAGRELKKRPFGECAETFSEFRKLIKDSRQSADYLLHALNEIKKEVGYAPDEKERRVRTLLKESGADSKDRESGNFRQGKRHEDIVKMAGWGMTEKEIADTLDLTEGEICLTLDIHRKKNENFAPHDSI